MKRFAIAAAAIALVFPLAVAQDQSAEAQDPHDDIEMETEIDDSGALFASSSVLTQQTGQGIYRAVCSGCHMDEGEGAVGAGAYPALADNPRLAAAGYPIFITIHGNGAMPPLGGVLDDAQIAAVVEYIRTSFGNEFAEPVTAEDVAAAR